VNGSEVGAANNSPGLIIYTSILPLLPLPPATLLLEPLGHAGDRGDVQRQAGQPGLRAKDMGAIELMGRASKRCQHDFVPEQDIKYYKF
jgi:hypothetical protein